MPASRLRGADGRRTQVPQQRAQVLAAGPDRRHLQALWSLERTEDVSALLVSWWSGQPVEHPNVESS